MNDMQLLMISSMGLSFCVLASLFVKAGESADRKRRRMDLIAGKKKRVYDEDLTDPFLRRFLIPTLTGVIKSFSRLFPRKQQMQTSKLERDLRMAGIKVSPSEYAATRLIAVTLILASSIGAALFLDIPVIAKAALYCLGILLALLGPRYLIGSLIKKRQLDIFHQIPDILDLLTVSVEAGLSFDGALAYIEQYHRGSFVEELSVVKKEIQMGLPRREALKNLGERNNIPELKSFVAALIQSDQIGLPIRNVLRAQASHIRLQRKQAAEEKAMKAPVKMMLPVVGLIFPVIFIILLGPTVMNLIKTFG
jgi:tight adherence protein C